MTPRQLQVLRAIKRLMDASAVVPSIREIGNAAGIEERNARKHVSNLIAAGYLNRYKRCRGLKLTAKGVVALAKSEE